MDLPSVDLNRLIIFLRVMEAGGFTAAAKRLGVAKTHVSQQIARLETEMGMALFTRNTRRVVPTDGGQRLYADCAPLLLQLEGVLESLTEEESQPQGLLRVMVSTGFGQNVIAPFVTEFLALHPRLHIELMVTDDTLDLVVHRVDVAIRYSPLRDSSLHARNVGQFRRFVVASPEYLARNGTPKLPEDLANHSWVTFSRIASPNTWTFFHDSGEEVTVHTSGRLRADNPATLQSLLREGNGISAVTEFDCMNDLRRGELVALLPDWHLPLKTIHAVYPDTRHVPPRVRLFIQALERHLGNTVFASSAP